MSSYNSFKSEFDKISVPAQLFIVDAVAQALNNPTQPYQSFSVEQFKKRANLKDVSPAILHEFVREAQQVLCSFESGTGKDFSFQSWGVFDEIFIFDGNIHFKITSSMYSLEMASLTLKPYPYHHKTLLKYEEYWHTQ